MEQLHAFVISEDDINSLKERGVKRSQDIKRELKQIENRACGLFNDMSSLIELYKTGSISIEGFKARYDPLDIQRNQLLEQIPKLNAELDHLIIQAD